MTQVSISQAQQLLSCAKSTKLFIVMEREKHTMYTEIQIRRDTERDIKRNGRYKRDGKREERRMRNCRRQKVRAILSKTHYSLRVSRRTFDTCRFYKTATDALRKIFVSLKSRVSLIRCDGKHNGYPFDSCKMRLRQYTHCRTVPED